MHHLLAVAHATLIDSTSTPAVKAAAAEALLAAFSNGVVLPIGSAFALWQHFIACPGTRVWHVRTLGDVLDIDVLQGALAVVRDEDAGDELHEVALSVLAGRALARLVPDELLLMFCERVNRDEVQYFVGLVSAVHEARGLDADVLKHIRDKLSSSPDPDLREASLDVAAELVEADVAFIQRMLQDEHACVRTATASKLSFGMEGLVEAAPIIQERLLVEQHPSVRAELLRAQAAAIEAVEIEAGTAEPALRRRPTRPR
jgi:hypothetical protein